MSADLSLSGATAVITGASRGLGVELVRAFAAAGANVAFCARRDTQDFAREISQQGGQALSRVADVTDPAAVARFAEAVRARFGAVDLLVNNVGIAGPTAPLGAITLAQWDFILRANVTGAFLMAQAFAPDMQRRGGGVILNIGSVTGKRPLVCRLPYATSKTALIGFTRTLAAELGPEGIRVNLLSPDAVLGERIEEVIRAQAQASDQAEADILAEFERRAPLGAMVGPTDVAALAVFLCSPAAAKITGQDINISAGAVMY